MTLGAIWQRSILLEKLGQTGAVRSEHMGEGSPLMKMLTEVGERVDRLERTVKTRDGQIADLKDYVAALQAERDELLSQLMQAKGMKGAAE